MSNRLDRVRKLLDEHSLDAILITNGTNRRYLSGYTADDHAPDESSGVVLVDRDSSVLFTSPINAGWATAEAAEGITVAHWERPWTASIAGTAREKRWQRLGFEETVTTVANYFDLEAGLPEEFDLIPIGDAVDRLRAVKDETEIALLEKALKLTDIAFAAAASQLAEGMSEIEFAEIVRTELRNAGSEGEAFPTIVASGPNAANPHHNPGDRQIRAGEPVIIDMGARHQGYNGDLTRTIWVGEPEPRLIEIYNLVQEAQNAARAGSKSGESGKQADAYCRDVFVLAGLDQYYIHSTGHGLGLRVHEAPSASMLSDAILQPGEVVTVEPGLYLPDWGGVRIEDVVLITENSNRNLTGAPKNQPAGT
jgi:Xaa-Pro aminopeptidase